MTNFRVLRGSEEEELRLSQNPALLEVAARAGERAVVRMTTPSQTAITQELVNVVMDCQPLLQQSSGGEITWFQQRIDQFGVLIGQEAQIFRSPFARVRVEGSNDRFLNITRTNIVAAAEDPDSGIYCCEVCPSAGTCSSRNVTLYLLGAPPDINETRPSAGMSQLIRHRLFSVKSCIQAL